jgi:WD40 repeat protein
VKRSRRRPLVEKIEIREEGKVVVAQRVDSLHMHSSPTPPTLPLNPFATIPPLPPSFINRVELSEPVAHKLLSSSGTMALTALEGMGGVGKSMLALGICHDPRVRARFFDGIIWLEIGKEAKISKEDRIRRIADVLNQKFNEYSEETYRTLLSDRSMLVVLDDVWTQEAVEPFLVNSGRSRLLYTSRDKGLAGPLGADNHEVGTLDEVQAREFLAIWAGRTKEDLPEPYGSEILTECKGLTLALAMIGAALKGKPNQRWEYLLTDLKKAKLREIGVRPAGYQYRNLHASIAVSVDALEPSQKTNYFRLAVLPEDVAAHPLMLQRLWGADMRSVDDLVQVYVDRSLGSWDAGGGMRIHDLQLDYIRGEHPAPSALDLACRALMRSYHVVRSWPEQFSSQMIGRLLPYETEPGVAAFLKELDTNEPRPRLRPLRPALQAADGQTISVLHLTYSPRFVSLSGDGKRAITWSYDFEKTVWVWDLEGKQPPRPLEHRYGVENLALSPNGKHLISVSSVEGDDDDNEPHVATLWIWNLEGKHPPQTLKTQLRYVTAMAVSDDKRRALYGSGEKVWVWDLEGKQPPRVLKGHASFVTALALSSDGKRALSGSDDATVRLWDLEGKRKIRVLEGHKVTVNDVALSSDGKRAVSGSDDHTVRVWDLEGKQPPQVLEGHTESVNAVALSWDGKRVVSGSDDSTVRVWDLEGKQPPRVLEGHTERVSAIGLSWDGKRVFSGSAGDRTIRVWDLESKQPPRDMGGRLGRVNAVALSWDGKRALSGSDDHTVRVWDLEGKQPPRELAGHKSRISVVALSGDGRRALSGSDDNTVRVWDLEGKQPCQVLERHTSGFRVLALSGDGKRALSSSDDNTVRVWDLEAKQAPRILEGRAGRVTAMALSWDGKRAVFGSDDNTVRVWDLEGKHFPQVLEGHTESVNAVALSWDGKLAVSGSNDGTVRVWDPEKKHLPRVLEGHTGNVTTVALSGDGRRTLSGSDDNTVRVWDLKTNKQIAGFTCDRAVTSCSWGQDRVVAGDEGGQVHVFAWEE